MPIRWRRQRQKALEKRSISQQRGRLSARSTAMLAAPLRIPTHGCYAPDDYAALKDSTSWKSQWCGASSSARDQNSSDRVVVISALDGSPAADAELMNSTCRNSLGERHMAVADLGLEGTANCSARRRGDARFC